jgi:hypothetical protein
MVPNSKNRALIFKKHKTHCSTSSATALHRLSLAVLAPTSAGVPTHCIQYPTDVASGRTKKFGVGSNDYSEAPGRDNDRKKEK